MKSILYMFTRTIKNSIVDLYYHPLRLTMYIFIILCVIGGAFSALSATKYMTNEVLDIHILKGAYTILIYIISIPVILKSVESENNFFKMSDVVNIFVAPISEKKILIYGVGRQLLTMVLFVISFLSYGSIAVKLFNISAFNALVLVLGIILMIILVQLVTMMIYSVCSGNLKRINIAKYIIYFIVFIPLALATVYFFNRGVSIDGFGETFSLPFLNYVPIFGWLNGLVFGIIFKNNIEIIIYSILIILFIICTITLFKISKIDYFEDVLQRTQSFYETMNDYKSGKITDSMMLGNKKIKVNKIGIGRGKGANTVFFKHITEASRRSRVIFLNINTVVLLITFALIGFGIKATDVNYDWKRLLTIFLMIVIGSYIQFFFSTIDDWIKELNKPYIYLIPENPFKKLIMASMTSLIKPFIDGVISFTLAGIVFGLSITDIIIGMAVYTSFGFVYNSANILTQRVIGLTGSRGIMVTLYMAIVTIMILPGVIIAVMMLVNMFVSGKFYLSIYAGIPVSIWNTVVSIIMYALCRNVLNNIES